MPAVMGGRDVIRGKNLWWIDNHKVHSAEVKGPFPNGDRFALIYNFVVTLTAGQGQGKSKQDEGEGEESRPASRDRAHRPS